MVVFGVARYLHIPSFCYCPMDFLYSFLLFLLLYFVNRVSISLLIIIVIKIISQCWLLNTNIVQLYLYSLFVLFIQCCQHSGTICDFHTNELLAAYTTRFKPQIVHKKIPVPSRKYDRQLYSSIRLICLGFWFWHLVYRYFIN